MEGTITKKNTEPKAKRPPKPLKSQKTQPTTENLAVASSSRNPINEDQRKLKRTLAKREYAQRTRLRQQLYVIELEEQVNFLRAQIATMARTIKQVDSQYSMMKADNASMKQKFSEYTDEITSKEAQYEELKKEKAAALKQLYADQQQKHAAR